MIRIVKIAIAILMAIALLSAGYFGFSSKTGNGVLVVDLSVVAKAIDRDSEITQQMLQAEAYLNRQLSDIKNTLEKELLEANSKLDKKSNDEEKEKVKTLTYQAGNKMRQAQGTARSKAQQYQASLLQKFRNEIRPIVKKIAHERNASMVRFADSSILWFDDAIDITDEVIAAVRTNFRRAPPVVDNVSGNTPSEITQPEI